MSAPLRVRQEDGALAGWGAFAGLALWVLFDPTRVVWFGVVYALGLAAAVLLAGARRRLALVHGAAVHLATVLLSFLERV